MHIMKKLLSLTLSALLILSLLPAGVMAEETTGWTVTASVNSDAVGYMTDGATSVDGSSRWTSNGGIGTGQSYESVSITIAFDSPTNVQSVKLCSGTDYAVAYTAYVSSTGEDDSWTAVSSSTEGTATDDYQTISINSNSISYIKIECTQSTNYGYNFWSIYELTVVESNGWTAEVSSTGSGDSADYMFDGDTSTRWSNGNADAAWVIVDFGKTTEVYSLSLLSTASDFAEGYAISISDDKETWTSIISDESNGAELMSGDYQIFDFGSTYSGRYLKIECTKTNSDGWHYWSIYELAINVDTASSGDDEQVTTWQITASDEDYNSGKMIDGDYTIDGDHRWNTWGSVGYDSSDYEKVTVTLNLGSAESVSSIRLLSCNDYALEYTLEYSTDGSNWTAISSNYTVSNNYQIITFDTVYAQYLRITCTKSCENSYWSIYEIDINVTDEESDPVLPSLYGWALTLDGRIGVTYYFDMTDVDDADSYVLNVTIGERSETISHGDSKTDGTEDNTTEYYRYTVYVGVAEINSTITATISYGDNVVEVTDYSVAEYCSTAIESNLAESSLCTALLKYGYYAGVFNSKDTGLSDYADLSSVSVSIDEGTYGSTTTTGYAKTLVLDDVIYIRAYMTSSVAVHVDGVAYTPESNTEVEGYSYSVDIPVSAQNLYKMYSICDADGEVLTKYSVYSYILNNYGNSDTNLANLCLAIYNYGEAAKDYQGWH